MNLHDQWKALSGRIHGLLQAAKVHAQFRGFAGTDSYGTSEYLRVQIQEVITALDSFKTSFEDILSHQALDCINKSVPGIAERVKSPDAGVEARVGAALVRLADFESEFSFVLSDFQQSIRAKSELAFTHLQRLIVVDEAFRTKWNEAFTAGEVACEKLDAVHLLQHGIYAFKVGAARAGTDLVFQDPVTGRADEQRYADGLVLTEWKLAKSRNDVTKRFEEARAQASLYAQGALAGAELTGYRYAIVVSSQQVSVPNDVTDAGVVYRHINIAVKPRTPSRASRTV